MIRTQIGRQTTGDLEEAAIVCQFSVDIGRAGVGGKQRHKPAPLQEVPWNLFAKITAPTLDECLIRDRSTCILDILEANFDNLNFGSAERIIATLGLSVVAGLPWTTFTDPVSYTCSTTMYEDLFLYLILQKYIPDVSPGRCRSRVTERSFEDKLPGLR